MSSPWDTKVTTAIKKKKKKMKQKESLISPIDGQLAE